MQFRSTYLEKGAYAISARTDRSEHSFAKATDHPRWDPKSTKGTAVEVQDTWGSYRGNRGVVGHSSLILTLVFLNYFFIIWIHFIIL